jgi:hypothetical protein
LRWRKVDGLERTNTIQFWGVIAGF